MVVLFSSNFEKELKKKTSQTEAKEIVKILMKTKPTDGDYLALVKNVLIRERKLKTFRFYFVQQNDKVEIMTKEEISDRILKFVALSKKNNQQDIIDKLKKELLEFGFEF